MLDTDVLTASIDFDELPFDAFQEAASIILDLNLKGKAEAWSAILLLTGIWENETGLGSYTVLPWSPLKAAKDADIVGSSKRWVLQHFATAILGLDTAARRLWKKKWPLRCNQSFIRGDYPSSIHCKLS